MNIKHDINGRKISVNIYINNYGKINNALQIEKHTISSIQINLEQYQLCNNYSIKTSYSYLLSSSCQIQFYQYTWKSSTNNTGKILEHLLVFKEHTSFYIVMM